VAGTAASVALLVSEVIAAKDDAETTGAFDVASRDRSKTARGAAASLDLLASVDVAAKDDDGDAGFAESAVWNLLRCGAAASVALLASEAGAAKLDGKTTVGAFADSAVLASVARSMTTRCNAVC
jgi:hypothetical protein